MKHGLWISQSEFKSFAAVDRVGSLSDEIATRRRSIDFYSLGMYLPNPDPVLKKMGKNIAVYKELRADPIVRGCIASRKARTKSLLWEIDRGKAKSRQAKFIADVFKKLPVRRIINQILNAPLFGYQPLEVLWNTTTWTPVDVVAKPQQWFVFDENNQPRFLTKENMMLGEELKPKKFIFAANEADYENPYGDAILSSCFWPVTFRKGGYKFWVTFTEKFGMPFIVGKQPRGTGQTETDAFANKLAAMVQDAIAVVPDDNSVEIPETKNTGSADLYYKLIQACTGEINVAVLGHSAGAESTPGKLGSETTAEGTGENIGDDDARLVEDTMNTLIDYTCEYNFSERGDRPRFITYQEEDVDKALAERDDKLSTSLDKSGLRLTRQYYIKGYALDEEDVEEKPAEAVRSEGLGVRGLGQELQGQGSRAKGQGGGSEFSAATQNPEDPIDNAVSDLNAADLQKQMEGVLKPVIDLINSGSSFDDIMKDMVKAYPKMNSADIEEMLARALFVSESWGMIEAEKKRAGTRGRDI